MANITKQKTNELQRCPWSGTDPLYVQYHDEEWGVPVHDDKKMFEFLILESAQAGLSWITILKRREGYRKAFANFEAEKVALFKDEDVERLMQDVGIIRNKAKIVAAINNAKIFLQIQREHGSFCNYIWSYLPNSKPIKNQFKSQKEVPANTPLSDKISKDLKKRGFKFFGTTICYAHLQAVGMVNDHIISCFRHKNA